ncbi:hypothetical protein WAI453_012105 [Rhynchosporium graminicola]
MTSSIQSAILRCRTKLPPVTAIYDIVWQASTSPSAPLSIQTSYAGSRILFRKEPVTTRSLSPSGEDYAFTAVLKFDDWEGVYGCEESLFENFEITTARLKTATFKLTPMPPTSSPDYISLSATTSPPSLTVKFCSLDNEGYPFICFQVETPTEVRDREGELLKMCAIGWAKRREFDDEVPGVIDTCLIDGEKERLDGTGQINMDRLERDGEKEREMEGLEEGEVKE